MQWQVNTHPSESLTVLEILQVSEITQSYAQYVLLVGQRYLQAKSMLQYSESPLLEQLSCSAERLTMAHSRLLSWTEQNGLGNGLMIQTLAKKHSNGYAKCLQMLEECTITAALANLTEMAYTSD
jgi:hypothetical protein